MGQDKDNASTLYSLASKSGRGSHMSGIESSTPTIKLVSQSPTPSIDQDGGKNVGPTAASDADDGEENDSRQAEETLAPSPSPTQYLDADHGEKSKSWRSSATLPLADTDSAGKENHDETIKTINSPSPSKYQDVEKASSAQEQKSSGPPKQPDWDGPDDPENPFNWPFWKKAYHMGSISIACWTCTNSASIFAPGYFEVMQEFHCSTPVAFLGITLFMIGSAFGPCLAAPISETYGRRVVYRFSLLLLGVWSIGAACAHNLETLLICRFFAGFSGSATLAVGGGTIADLCPPKDRAVATILFQLASFAGPSLGPTIGGFAAQDRGWRWTMWSVVITSLSSWFLCLGHSETFKKAIIQKRAKRSGATLNGPQGGAPMLKRTMIATLGRPIHMLFTEPIVLFLSLYSAFNFSVMFCFVAAFTSIFGNTYGFSPGSAGLTFLAIFAGFSLGAFTLLLFDRLKYRKARMQAAQGPPVNITPESRLLPAMLGSFGVPLGLFWFAWTARPSIHWICPVIATAPIGWGTLTVFSSTAVYLIDTYGPMYGASSLGATGLLRFGLGASFPLFSVTMYNSLGVGWATSLLGFVSLALLPVPWVLYKYGERIRAKTNYPKAPP